jgi:iron complex transport system ATP-binding protein
MRQAAAPMTSCGPVPEILLQAERLSAGYAAAFVLKDISLEIRAGETWGLIGPNGSGKTTLLRALSGVLPLRDGEVILKGRPLSAFQDRDRARLLAVVPQSLDVPVPLTVWELVSQGRLPHASGWAPFSSADRAAIERALETMEIAPLAHRRLDELSSGERQRAIVAMALAQEPQVLLLDEPTAHMDVQHADSLLRRIKRIALERGLAVAASLHDFNLAAAYCDYALLLKRGCAFGVGRIGEVLRRENLERVYGMPIEILRRSDGAPAIAPLYGAAEGGSSVGGAAGAAGVASTGF